MLYKTLYSFRVLSATVALTLVLSTPMQPIVVLAQEMAGTPVVQETTPAPEVQQSQTPDTPENGENGSNGGETTPPAEGDGADGSASALPAEVTTGDAGSVSDSGNETNTNDVTTPGTGDTTLNLDNNATTTATTTADALTGENAATGGSGGASINTGDAFASGNAINVVNTNIIDSSGMLLFLNMLFGNGYDFRDLDLSYFFGTGSTTMNGCTLIGCSGADVNINADNTATVLNSVIVRSMTGGNTANGEGGASINTGDAYAAGNAVNLVNSNLINSNYLLVSFNSFGDMGDDIILPGADFFNKLFAQQNAQSGALTVNASNTAQVVDSTAATADSGSNTATTGDGSASVETGNAIASATSYNQVNSTMIGGTQVFFLFRIWGDWAGSITGLPDGMMWRETPMGIELMNADGSPAPASALGDDDCCAGGSLNANLNNTALLNNNVNVYALTGENRADSASSTAEISTGNAYASANSVNLVNTNLIGRNWIFMIFNIFGNFSGNISFGRPDLWIGAVAETVNPTMPGTGITYKFTIANK